MSGAGGGRPGLLGRWVAHATFGEFAGFMLPAAVWGGLASRGFSDTALYLPVVVAGAGEGFVLGWAQSRVLSPEIRGFERHEWIRNTAVAAGAAWSVGMLPSMLSDAFGDAVPDALLIAIAAVGAVVLLSSIGWAQSLVLRRHVERWKRWITVNALAWFAGLPFTFLAFAIAPDEPLPRLVFAAAGGLAMAATVALITGLVLVGLLAPGSGSSGD